MSVPATALRAPLTAEFFARSPRAVARDLIGCELECDDVGGTIVETEAYEQDEPACHAFVGRTERTDVLFGPPGRAYVYLCYGIHHMFNIVAERDGVAAAVLVRALVPERGLELMRRRRGGDRARRELCSGPGKLCEALAIELGLTYAPVWEPPLRVMGRAPGTPEPAIVTGPRIGINKAAELPWRYCLAGSPFLSHPA